jgi:glycosyltransferase involved in cell wall biosynthesis
VSDVAIDITRLLGRYLKKRLPTGVDRVSLEYIRYFSPRAYAIVRYLGRTIVLSVDESQFLFDALLSVDFSLRRNVVLKIAKVFSLLRRSPDIRGTVLFNTGHSGLEKPEYPLHLQKLGVKPVFFIHDLIPITHPEYCRSGEKEKHVIRMKTTLALAKGVIANSQFTLDSLQAFADSQALPVPSAAVALLAPAKLSLSNAPRPIEGPYFVILGTIEPRKNHQLLVDVWRKLLASQLAITPTLVVIGQRGWDVEALMQTLEHDQALKPHVQLLSSCSDAQLANYLQHTQALLFPSFVEGFGMPLVEALSIGVPVIASDIAAFHEIAGIIPEYLDPHDPAVWTEMVLRYCRDEDSTRQQQLQRIKTFSPTSWPQHFHAVEALLKKLS